MLEDPFKDYVEQKEDYVVCPTTSKKLHPVSMLPLEDHVDFTNKSLDGENITLCERCGDRGAFKARQRTAYIDEELNWVTLCEPCHEENAEYWNEMWAEYYAGRL